MLVEVVAVIAAPSVLAIGKRVREVAVERVPLATRTTINRSLNRGGGLGGKGRYSSIGGDGTRIKLYRY